MDSEKFHANITSKPPLHRTAMRQLPKLATLKQRQPPPDDTVLRARIGSFLLN